VLQKRMFKVISPIEKRNGEKFWMRLGSAYTNKDDSINIYLDAFPVGNGKEVTLQLRELTEEDLAQNKQRAAFQLPRSSTTTAPAPAGADQPVPF